MEASAFVGKVFTKFKGKPAAKAPKPGNPKFTMYLDIANEKVRDWVEDSNYVWRTIRRTERITVADARIPLPEDYARLADTELFVDGKRIKYVTYAERYDGHNAVYEDGYELVLTKPEKHIGKTIELSIIYYPPEVTTADGSFVCDSMNWLVAATAAAVAFNDPQKQDNAPDLEGMAQVSYGRMAVRTRKGPKGYVRKVKRSTSPLGRTW